MSENLEQNPDKQRDNTDNIRPFMWKKGQSGNLAGRPKGKTLKEYVKEYLAKMTDEERDEWLEGIDKKEIWKMAEGNPAQGVEHSGEIELPIPLLDALRNNHSNKENQDPQ